MPAEPYGWTFQTMHEYFLRLLDERDYRYTQRFDAQQQAIYAAFAAQEKLVDSGFKESRVMLESTSERIDHYSARLTELERRINETSGHTRGSSDLWAYLVGAGALFAAITAVVIGFTK